jgi:putative ABC transport system substrate-binding protein
MGADMQRRDFIKTIVGSAVAWPLAARAQQTERMQRIGVLMGLAPDDQQGREWLAAFLQSLQELGWMDGRNVLIDVRWARGGTSGARKYAAELVGLAPDVILASGGGVTEILLQATRTIPIVFTLTPDPVGAGFVESLARPGGNATGFSIFEYDMAAKWLELLKKIAPLITRVAVVRDAAITQGTGLFGAIRSTAPLFGFEVTPVNVRDAGEIERTLAGFARGSNGGLIVTGSGAAIIHRKLILRLAARYRLPAIYFGRYFVADGGLMSYGVDPIDPHRRAAVYVDRILKGEKPADLPVEQPTRFDLVINLKTAKMLGLTVPPSLLATADEVIE